MMMPQKAAFHFEPTAGDFNDDDINAIGAGSAHGAGKKTGDLAHKSAMVPIALTGANPAKQSATG